jgi:hypothetical protein
LKWLRSPTSSVRKPSTGVTIVPVTATATNNGLSSAAAWTQDAYKHGLPQILLSPTLRSSAYSTMHRISVSFAPTHAPAGSLWHVPRTLIGPTSSPISSRVSRRAASIGVSSCSMCPPGKLTCVRL